MVVNYMVFGFGDYYPGGGMNDCKLKTNRKTEVKAFVENWKKEQPGWSLQQLQVYDVKKDWLIFEAEFNRKHNEAEVSWELVIKLDNL